MPPTDEPGDLDFSTWERWTASDVCAFVDSLDGCYRSLLVMRDSIEAAERERERNMRIQEETWRMYREMGPPHPEWEMWMEEMSRMWRKFGRRGIPPFMPTMLPQAFPSPAITPTSGPDRMLSYLLEHPEEVIAPSEQLFIRRIEMASPGGFTFHGLGEPLTQLRELIKDLWYRNRQERQRGELQILREKLELYSHLTLSVQHTDIISTYRFEDVKALGELVESGKLSLAGEEPRRTANPATGPTRARRRRKKPE